MVKMWKTKSGRKIKISDMDDNHLKNTIAMLHRQENVVLSNVVGIPMPSGEAAFDAVSEGLCDLAYAPYGMANPSYADLVNEATKRGLYEPKN